MDWKTLPKVELHCHLDGILDPTMAWEIYRNDPGFPIRLIEFERAYPITDYESFFRWWKFIEPIEGELAHFYPILALYEAGLVVGVALAGPERGNPVKPFHKTITRFHEAGLGIEIHAGEWCGPESIWDALEHGYPHRIGHGVSLFQDPKLIGLFQERQIHLELCPTSNLKTGSIAQIEEHPIGRARELGLNFSPMTM